MQSDYARMLCEKLGDGFNSVYFTNSGSEANDFASLHSDPQRDPLRSRDARLRRTQARLSYTQGCHIMNE